MDLRHITRFTYKFTNFQGWRVAIRRHGYTLTRYFSDRQYQDENAAYNQALQFRNKVLAELEQNPGNELAVLTSHSIRERKTYPAGLKPNNLQTKEKVGTEENCSCACSIRSNRVMQKILRRVCSRLKLDTASVVKLSVYLFTIQYGYAAHGIRNLSETDTPPFPKQAMHSNARDDAPQSFLYRLIDELEREGKKAGLPCFEEFATGKSQSQKQPVANTMSPPIPSKTSPAMYTLPSKLNRQSIAYFNHFYNSHKSQLPLPPFPYLHPITK